MPKLKELREKRGKAIADMRAVLDLAETEERDISTTEKEQYEKLFDEQKKSGDSIKLEERQQELDREAAAKIVPETTPGNGGASSKEESEKRAMTAFSRYLASGVTAGEGAEELRAIQQRALQQDVDIQGGYLVAPEQFVNEIIKGVDNMVFMRGLARVMPVTSAKSLGIPTLDTDVGDADWTAEIGTISADTAMRFGKRNLEPHKLTKYVPVSMDLLSSSAIPVEQLVAERLIYKKGVTEEKGYMTGSGAQQPLGVFTASDDGISTGRDVDTGNTTSTIVADNLKRVKYNLKSQYHGAAQWIFHPDAVLQVSLFKDGDGQYLWREGIQEGEPDRLLGFPINMSEYAPNTFETTLYVGILGDFSKYYIADSVAMQVQRLNELLALTSQIGFILRAHTDGMPVLEEAFSRVQLG